MGDEHAGLKDLQQNVNKSPSCPPLLQASGSGCLLAAGGAAAPALQMADLLIAPLPVVARQLVTLAQQQPLLRVLLRNVETEAAVEGGGEQAASRMLLLLPLSTAEQPHSPPASATVAAGSLHAATPALLSAAAAPAVFLQFTPAVQLRRRRNRWDKASRAIVSESESESEGEREGNAARRGRGASRGVSRGRQRSAGRGRSRSGGRQPSPAPQVDASRHPAEPAEPAKPAEPAEPSLVDSIFSVSGVFHQGVPALQISEGVGGWCSNPGASPAATVCTPPE